MEEVSSSVKSDLLTEVGPPARAKSRRHFHNTDKWLDRNGLLPKSHVDKCELVWKPLTRQVAAFFNEPALFASCSALFVGEARRLEN
jgi:hypothetical protein